ncbi:hypothetical protein O6H91_18G007700 [Diphasiastrum complanatum]|uniref:Uncharacterized protein n=1 Tax=Diphasiastrum complanatum TaxID=34168 RepID=A0ACC2AXU6_DIPCM|nr:hypothetical protein O6H91_18G007700 [Diphasiastrum complanatum]
MGIQGLLPAIKSVTTPVHVKEYAGKTVAVDTYSWLHKGAFTCCKELCKGQPTFKYVDYCMHKVNLLRHHGVKPLLVFDGGLLPMKAEQEAKRARTRKEHLNRAREHELSGNRSAAYESYQKAVDITPSIALGLIEVLRQECIDFIVAPYEADAQLAFLCLQGHVDAVITEDSDLVAYCCPKVLFKMDKYGQGEEFRFVNLGKSKDLNFTSFTKQMVLEMCVLSGCDYLSSLHGMGLKKAHGLIRRFKCYQKVIKHLRFSGLTISKDYDEKFEKAMLTFQHQRVYDSVKEDIVHVTDIPFSLGLNLDFLGPWLPQPLVKNIAKGVVDPLTLKPFENSIIYLSNWQEKVEQKKPVMHEQFEKKRIVLPVQKNLLTKYFTPASRASKQQFRAPRSTPESPDSAEDLFVSDSDNLPAKTFMETEILSAGTSDDLQEILGFEAYEQCQTANNNTGVQSCIAVVKEARKVEGIDVKSLESMEVYPLDDGNGATKAFDVLVSSNSFVGQSCVQSPFLLKRSSIKTSFEDKKSCKIVVRSGYFSSNATKTSACNKKCGASVLDKETEMMDEQDTTCVLDASEKNNENFEVVMPDMLTDKIEQQGYQSKKHSVTIRSTVVDEIAIAKNKHVPAFTSHLLIDLAHKQNFSSDLSHLDQYVSIAQRSVDQFVSSISSFECSAKGARVSGLRPPQRCSLRSNRNLVKASVKNVDFTRFAHSNDLG